MGLGEDPLGPEERCVCLQRVPNDPLTDAVGTRQCLQLLTRATQDQGGQDAASRRPSEGTGPGPGVLSEHSRQHLWGQPVAHRPGNREVP